MYIWKTSFNHKNIEMSTKIKTFSEPTNYPELIWMSDWAFGFDPLSSKTASLHNGTIFHTLSKKGSISGLDTKAWQIHVHLPHKSHITYFSNGIIVKRRTPLAIIASPAPNVLCGFIHKRYGMELVCEHGHIDKNGATHFYSGFGAATLLKKEQEDMICFSLAVNTGSQEEAYQLAKTHFAHTPEELISLHGCRRKIIDFLDIFPRLNALPALAGECLLKQLRSPEGVLHEPWPASPAQQHETFSLNELYPLLTAWTDIAPQQAQSMHNLALNLQRADGHFPTWVAPNGDRNSFDAPHLFFAQCAERLLQKTGDVSQAKNSLNKLNNYLRWSLRHFFPQGTIHPAGQSIHETLSPELWHKHFSSAEHTLLLICELESLIRLHEQTASTQPAFITQALNKLTLLLETEFWNPQTRTFSTCYLQEEANTRFGLHEYLPLLHRNLELKTRTTLLSQFKCSPWAHGFQADPATGEQTIPATPLQQFMILQCIKHPANSCAQTEAHINKTWNNLFRWQQHYFHKKLSIEMPPFDTAFICLLIDLQAHRTKFLQNSTRKMKWARILIQKLRITRDDLIILLVFGFLIFGTRMIYQNRAITASGATLQEAHTSYQARDLATTIDICKKILIKNANDQEARLMLANILLSTNSPEKAETEFRQLRKLDEDNPAFILGLAMSLHRRGNTAAANLYYQEFQNYFAPYFPDTAKVVTRMQNLDTPKLTKYFINRILASDIMKTL